MTRRSRATSSSDDSAVPNRGAALFSHNGWRIGFHPEILLQFERLIEAVEKDRRGNPERSTPSQPAQILASLRKLIFTDIPEDPTRAIYRQGQTLGRSRTHWFRAKFGNGRYRLFFRYRAQERILLFAWVNDERTLRTYGSSTDAYATFRGMLDDGNPPEDWDALLAACTTKEAIRRLRSIFEILQGRAPR
jgi:toxin YhaV